MTSQQGQLQALITEIEALLGRAAPKLPWMASSEVGEQRRVMEQSLAYLKDLQATAGQAAGWGGVAQPGEAIAPTAADNADTAEATTEANSQQVLQALLQEMQYLRAQMVQPLTSEVIALQQQRETLKNEVRQLEQARLQQAQGANVGQPSPAWVSEVVEQLRSALLEQLTPQIRALQGRGADNPALYGAIAPDLLTGADDLPQLTPQQRLEQLRQIQSQTDGMLLKLDANLRAVFESLDQSIQSYSDTLNQGLDAMHGLGQQGEFIFRAFINHLAEQLQAEGSELANRLASSQELARLQGQMDDAEAWSETDVAASDELMDAVVDFEDIDLDNLDAFDLDDDEEVTLFQLDEEFDDLPLESDAAAIATDEWEPDDEGEKTVIQTAPITTGPAAAATADERPAADGEPTVAYTQEIDALYDSLFGEASAESVSPPQASDDDAADAALDAQLLNVDTPELIAADVADSDRPEVSEVVPPAAADNTSLDLDFLLEAEDSAPPPAATTAETDASSAPPLEGLLGAEMAAELSPDAATAATPPTDKIASLTELLPESEQAQGARQADPFAAFDESEDTFIPAPPDENLLDTRTEASRTQVELTLDDATLGQLSSDLSRLEGGTIDESFSETLLIEDFADDLSIADADNGLARSDEGPAAAAPDAPEAADGMDEFAELFATDDSDLEPEPEFESTSDEALPLSRETESIVADGDFEAAAEPDAAAPLADPVAEEATVGFESTAGAEPDSDLDADWALGELFPEAEAIADSDESTAAQDSPSPTDGLDADAGDQGDRSVSADLEAETDSLEELDFAAAAPATEDGDEEEILPMSELDDFDPFDETPQVADRDRSETDEEPDPDSLANPVAETTTDDASDENFMDDFFTERPEPSPASEIAEEDEAISLDTIFDDASSPSPDATEAEPAVESDILDNLGEEAAMSDLAAAPELSEASDRPTLENAFGEDAIMPDRTEQPDVAESGSANEENLTLDNAFGEDAIAPDFPEAADDDTAAPTLEDAFGTALDDSPPSPADPRAIDEASFTFETLDDFAAAVSTSPLRFTPEPGFSVEGLFDLPAEDQPEPEPPLTLEDVDFGDDLADEPDATAPDLTLETDLFPTAEADAAGVSRTSSSDSVAPDALIDSLETGDLPDDIPPVTDDLSFETWGASLDASDEPAAVPPDEESLSFDELDLDFSLEAEPDLPNPGEAASAAATTAADLFSAISDVVLPTIDEVGAYSSEATTPAPSEFAAEPAEPALAGETETSDADPAAATLEDLSSLFAEASADSAAPVVEGTASAFSVTEAVDASISLTSDEPSDALMQALTNLPAGDNAADDALPFLETGLSAIDQPVPQPDPESLTDDWTVSGSATDGYQLNFEAPNAETVVDQALSGTDEATQTATEAAAPTTADAMQLQKQYGRKLTSMADMVAATSLPFSMPTSLSNIPDADAPMPTANEATDAGATGGQPLPNAGLPVVGSVEEGFTIALPEDEMALAESLRGLPAVEQETDATATPAAVESEAPAIAPLSPALELADADLDDTGAASREPSSAASDQLAERLDQEALNESPDVMAGFWSPVMEDRMADDFANASATAADFTTAEPGAAPLTDDELASFFPPQVEAAPEDSTGEDSEVLEPLFERAVGDRSDDASDDAIEAAPADSSNAVAADDLPDPQRVDDESLENTLFATAEGPPTDATALDDSVIAGGLHEAGQESPLSDENADAAADPDGTLEDLDLSMEEIPESEIAADEAFRSAFQDLPGEADEPSLSAEAIADLDALTTDQEVMAEARETEPLGEPTLEEDEEPTAETGSPAANAAVFASAGMLATLGDDETDDAFPGDADDAESPFQEEWFLGIDLGSSGLSAVLMEHHSGSAHPLCWVSEEPQTEPAANFRIPAVAALQLGDERDEADPPSEIMAVGQSALSRPAEMADQCLLHTLRPLLRVGIPHQTPEGAAAPLLQWSDEQTVTLNQVMAAVTSLLQLISQPAAAELRLEAIGLESALLDDALSQLQGVVMGLPTNWSDTYCFNMREAVLAAGLVESPSQVFFVEEAIAAMLSGLPDPSAPPADQNRQVQTLYQCNWQGGTVVISGGASCTEIGMVDLPQPLDALTREDFKLRNLAYGGDALDLDIICQLLAPPERRQAVNVRDRRPTNRGWGWQAALPEVANAHWADLELEAFDLPQLAEPDLGNRQRLRQHLETSKLGQSLLEAARYLKLILQNQNQYQLDLADQSWRVLRRDLESRVLVPYIQRINQQVNALLSQTGLASQGINQVICTGGNASFSTIAKWLRQKFPNATIIQDTYPSNRPQTCSRVAYGLVNLCRYPQVLDVPRHQYSDYFLLHEMMRLIPDAPLPFDGILHVLEEQGLNVEVCQSRIAAILEGHLPPGLLPDATTRTLFSRDTLTSSAYQNLATGSLFSKQTRNIYIVNAAQRDRLADYLATLIQSKEQSLSDPLIAQLVAV